MIWPDMRKLWVVGAVLVVVAAQVRVARADEPAIEVRWRAPADCPDQAAFVRTLAEQRGRAPRLQRNAATLFDARLERAPQGYELDLQTRADGVPGRRVLTSDDCATLTRVAAMIASVLIDHGIAQEPEPAQAQPPRFLLRAQAVADVGSLPAFAIGPSLALGVRSRATSFELGISYLPTQSVDVAAVRQQPAAELRLLTGSLGVCRAVWSAPELGPCARAEYGQLWGRGLGVANAQAGAAHWFFGWLGAHIAVELARALWLAGDLEAGARVLRAEFVVGTLGTVHEVPLFVARARLGLEWRP
jgi:hypothetical protein